jgi:hypothetical protein
MVRHIETAADYTEYEAIVADFFDREGIGNLSGCYGEECEECGGEAHFSWSPCDCCNRDLGGDRYHATGWAPVEQAVQTYRVCADCLYYAEYGVLDDQTMLDIGVTS